MRSCSNEEKTPETEWHWELRVRSGSGWKKITWTQESRRPGSLKGQEIRDAHPCIGHMPRIPGPEDISGLKHEVKQGTLEFLNKARPDISVFFGEILSR
jgi:hypothetical protein